MLHPHVCDLLNAANLEPSAITLEPDNAEYGGVVLEFAGTRVRFRVAKLTPRKVGAFLACWRRAVDGGTEPFPAEEDISALVVVVAEGSHRGAFCFPRDVLVERGILSGSGGGKRGFRVYPPWSLPSNRTAQATQRWQVEHWDPALTTLTAGRTSTATGSP